ncbi:shufflon system plasmid conjugative transfer pilus tip adhesin PilV [uncultured Desulfovibrio sp.]|uniref:shufflon system plasmid conjugative transfer pilus tip adhesin PilV n=1 Tax=uncultured Desulfovibrio sp. TaxID=167968 RepID=UPI0026049011|nr:shufflon system plasmid conjugative transfer pilus tip adhesin PilV [uncultured Desulfovibrio sp.]
MIQAIGMLLIFLLMIPGLTDLWIMGNTASQQRLAADHMRLVVQAARSYVNRHQDTLLSQTGPNSGPTVTIPTLVTEGFLHDGFSERNVWLQEYRIYVRQPETGQLQAAVLTTGGRGVTDAGDKFGNVTIPFTASLVGGAGGFIPTGVLPGQSDDMLQGAGNGWAVSLASLGIPSPGAGHLGALSTYDSSALGQDYLYRVAVPGNPELNAMQTSLDMTDHAINNVQSVQFVEREITTETCTAAEDQGRVFLDRIQGLYICRNNSLEIIGDSGNFTALKSAVVAKNGERITKPSCAPSTNTVPAIYTSPSLAEAGPDAPPLTAVDGLPDVGRVRLGYGVASLSARPDGRLFPRRR